MNNVNPVLASATHATYLQSNGLADATAKEPKVTEKSTAVTSSAGNSSVTLSDKNQTQQTDYLNLAKDRRVNEKDSAGSEPTEKGDTTNGLTYASNLQAQANYNAFNATNTKR
ncbi:hypothetical protein [Hydrogenovibrio kuenenii]|uniref:hypothetical protein n=1 Tax=Hydrogenovibrio kuenenii TaxID=63658 RepID=UPI0004660F9D|nr:hypothetical protein [Hydrogenovibrio kuenenii]